MGKKARKLRSPKYAEKASALRNTVERLRGHITETAETVSEPTVETPVELIQEPFQEDDLTQTIDEVVEEIVPTPEEPVISKPNGLTFTDQRGEAKGIPEKRASSTIHKKTTPSTTRKTTTTTRKSRRAKTKTTG